MRTMAFRNWLLYRTHQRKGRASTIPHRLRLEQLEERLVPSASWTGAGGNNDWDTPANWTGANGGIPGVGTQVGADVFIENAATTIVHSNPDETVVLGSLTTDANSALDWAAG